MTQGELAAYIDSHLRGHGIQVVLSGGASVAIYSKHKYVSKDLDFVARFFIDHKKVESVMSEISFEKRGKYYHHTQTPYFVEFISGPPSVGKEPIKDFHEIKFETGVVRVISPTDSVKDRLAAFYHWGDKQSLSQALLVANHESVDIKNIESWSIKEGKKEEFEVFKRQLRN